MPWFGVYSVIKGSIGVKLQLHLFHPKQTFQMLNHLDLEFGNWHHTGTKNARVCVQPSRKGLLIVKSYDNMTCPQNSNPNEISFLSLEIGTTQALIKPGFVFSQAKRVS